MSEVIKPNQTEINTSLASHLSEVATSPRLPILSASFYMDQARNAGYEGIEWHPLRNSTIAGIQTNTGLLLAQDEKDYIRSAHQTWRTQRSIAEALRHPNKAIALGSYALFTEADDSLRAIEDLQIKLGRKLPTVVYPELEATRDFWDFETKTFQPKKSVMEALGAKDIPDMIEKAKAMGFTGITADIHHMLDLGAWQDVLPQILPFTTEIHIAVGRVDGLNVDPQTMTKLEDLYFGRRGSEIYQILEMIKNSGWTGMVVTEIPAAALRELRAKNKDRITSADFVEDHRKIVDNLKEALK